MIARSIQNLKKKGLIKSPEEEEEEGDEDDSNSPHRAESANIQSNQTQELSEVENHNEPSSEPLPSQQTLPEINNEVVADETDDKLQSGANDDKRITENQ